MKEGEPFVQTLYREAPRAPLNKFPWNLLFKLGETCATFQWPCSEAREMKRGGEGIIRAWLGNKFEVPNEGEGRRDSFHSSVGKNAWTVDVNDSTIKRK